MTVSTVRAKRLRVDIAPQFAAFDGRLEQRLDLTSCGTCVLDQMTAEEIVGEVTL